MLYRESTADIYTDGEQTVTLYTNGRFTADLAHNVRHRGDYTATADNDGVAVTFAYRGQNATAWIEGGVFTLPPEWRDHHGHNDRLPRK